MELNRDELAELQTIRKKMQVLLWEAPDIMPVYPEKPDWITIILFDLNRMKDALDEMENELAEYESERR